MGTTKTAVAVDDKALKALGLEGVRFEIERAHQRIDAITEELGHLKSSLKNYRECERAFVRPQAGTTEEMLLGLAMHYALCLPNDHPKKPAIRARAIAESEAWQAAQKKDVDE